MSRIAKYPVEVPKALLSQEVDRQRQQAIQRFGGNAQNIKPEMLPNELFEEASRRSVALGLLLSEIIAKNDVKVDGDRVKPSFSNTGSSRPFSGAQNSMNSNPSRPSGFSNRSAMISLRGDR